MNPLMVQMFAEKMGMTQEQVTAMANGDAPTRADPRMNTMMQLMADRTKASEAEASEVAELAGQLDQAERRINLLAAKLKAARGAIAHIGESLGACSQCWGTDSNCRHCAGRGKPGAYTPDEDQLRSMVEPALARLGLAIASAEGISAPKPKS